MLRIGFIGVGGIAQTHVKNVQESGIAEIVAVSDINEEAANRTAAQCGAAAYRDSLAMLDSEKLDAVFVCVPPFAHGDIEEQIVRRGVHLFVEKPLGLDMATVEEKAKVIRESGVISGTGYCLRYWDIVQEAKTFLADKQVALVNGYYCTSFVPTPWWRVMSKSGGQLVEQTTHIVDLLRYLGGEVASVHAYMNRVASDDIENLDIYDVGTMGILFQHGGVGQVSTTFIQPDHRSGIEIMGRGFRITIDNGTLTIVEGNDTSVKKSSVDFYKEQDLAFLKALETGNRELILAPYDEALRTLQITLAANESAQTGRTVAL